MKNYFKRIIDDKRGQGFTWGILSIVATISFTVFAFLNAMFGKGSHESRNKVVGTLFTLGVISSLAIAGLYTDTIPGWKDKLVFTKPGAAGGTGGQPTGSGGAVDIPLIKVSGADSTVTWSSINEFTGLPTGGTHRYLISKDGGITFGAARTVTDAATATLSPGDFVKTLFRNASTAGNDAYFSAVSEKTIGSGGTDQVEAKLYQNGTYTITVYDTDDNALSTVEPYATNQSLTTGDEKRLKVKLVGTFERAAPYGMIGVIDYNDSSIDKAILNFYGVGDEEAQSTYLTSVPKAHTQTYLNWKSVAFEVPAQYGSSDLIGYLFLKVDSAVEPVQNVTTATITFYKKNYYVNEDNKGAFTGPSAEDEDNVLTMPPSFGQRIAIE